MQVVYLGDNPRKHVGDWGNETTTGRTPYRASTMGKWSSVSLENYGKQKITQDIPQRRGTEVPKGEGAGTFIHLPPLVTG